ncbi:NitT/TauT family transport system ATP-binding protein [Paracoccus halophilus]|uniref:NitT/TauT family transport system ATP-binding protein n=1 Tax=Paracoccus halophilus TaxID=376733 RepID=A0A099EU05_9RHOB|nr:ABC transporter substrate-binding protein [Paracoccus halophilus]KGJ01885.1 nitrate transporter [Paracoccus halophilus]SFA62487.1 NitT/TauT family transport system ATP-binding protein [Paracoccus halophilus]
MISLRLGYVPLIDAAPLIVAQELGFAAEEGLRLELVRLGAWTQARDMLGAGMIDAAHMLMPIPIGQALGLGPPLPPMDLVMFMSQGGQVIAVNRTIEARLRGIGYGFDFADPRAAGQALRNVVAAPLRVGVPFTFSTHLELTDYWLRVSGFAPEEVKLITVPPPRMTDAMAAGEVDMFCVGEPWASFAVEREAAALLLPGTSIWAAPPEKGLVLRRDFTAVRPDETGALMRAVWRAGRWLDQPDQRGLAAEIISRAGYLDLPPELADRGLSGRLLLCADGELREAPRFIAFNAGAASFPWRSIAALIAKRIALRYGKDIDVAMARAMQHFRTDLYRKHLRPAGAALPGASSRLEGMLVEDRMVAAESGQMILHADGFFDGFTFEPPEQFSSIS